MTNREIDAAVAEKVMGWKRWQLDGRPELGCGLFPPECKFSSNWIPAPADMPFNGNGEFGPNYGPFRASTDPAASDQLLNRMTELGWDLGLQSAAGYDSWAIFSRRGVNGLPSGNGFDARGKTRQMAVALAALAAFGVEVA